MSIPTSTLILLLLVGLSMTTSLAEPTHCTGCIDGQPTSSCPSPQSCGYAPILCVNCMQGMPMPQCPNATWCPTNVPCQDCINGQPTTGCPDPGTCGFTPIPCSGCVPGMYRDKCPHPEWCYQDMTTPPCMDCMAGMAMPYCPNATFCSIPSPMPPVSSSSSSSGATASSSSSSTSHDSSTGGMTSTGSRSSSSGSGSGASGSGASAISSSGMGSTSIYSSSSTGSMIMSSSSTGDSPIQAEHCTGCIDGQPTASCPKPQQCGYAPIMCVDCMMGMPMPQCPNATACMDVDCAISSPYCIDYQPTPNCPDPGTCGFKPIPCYGCVPGLWHVACPHPEWCYQNMTTPPCMDCMAGMGMPFCPNATVCMAGIGPIPNASAPIPPPGPIECIDCMAGMSMPHCPRPDLCPSGCMMQMYFGASSSTCLFLQSWSISDGMQWTGAFFTVLLLALLREGLGVYRVHKHLQLKQEDNIRRMKHGALNQKQPSSSPSSSPSVITSSSAATSSVQMKSKPLLTDVGGPASSETYGLSRHALESSSFNSSLDRHFKLPAPESDFALHFFDSFYYFFSLVLGYLLMLVIMTYNVWLCLMVVFTCFLCHFIWNYLYHTRWKRQYLHQIKCLVQEWHQSHGQLQSSSADPTGLIVDTGAKPASGDHCCEDINFDDI